MLCHSMLADARMKCATQSCTQCKAVIDRVASQCLDDASCTARMGVSNPDLLTRPATQHWGLNGGSFVELLHQLKYADAFQSCGAETPLHKYDVRFNAVCGDSRPHDVSS